MNKKVHLIRKRRYYTCDFKKSLVREFESGKFSVTDLGKLHNIQYNIIYRWIYKYSTVNKKGYRVVEKEESSTKKLKNYEKRISELEQALGRKQIKIDYLEKLIEIAGKDYNIDIKKK